MKVFKFGGASVKDAAGVKNLQSIIELYKNEKLVVVISAIGKTTNLLEKITEAYFYSKNELESLVNELKDNHFLIARELGNAIPVIADLNVVFDRLSLKLKHTPSENYDFEYDQIVSFGEMLSTTLISSYLNDAGVQNTWIDARKIIRTDHTYREGRVDWEKTTQLIDEQINLLLREDKTRLVITQGFIGGTAEMETTTLGREGSDYSASIMAYALNAEDVTIWKDVPGLLNADPKYFPEAVKLDKIPYEEAIELSYYGATVIHPKTLKPLQNKKIPLYVKPFLDPSAAGSVITDTRQTTLTPSYIFKRDQILLSIYPKDFSFITTEHLSTIFLILSNNKIKINLMQNSALSFSICVDHKPVRVENVIEQLSGEYKVKYNEKMELITIRHYSDDIASRIVKSRKIYIEQKNRTTLQIVVKEEIKA